MLPSEFALLIATATESEQAKLLQDNPRFSAIEVAEELRQICYEAWMSDPDTTARISSAMRLIHEADGSLTVTAIRYWVDGILAMTKGSMAEAVEYLEHSSKLYLKNGQNLSAAETSIGRMYALAVLGRYDDAIEAGISARNVAIEHGAAKSAGKIEHNLGNIYQRLDRYAEAEEYHRLAIDRFSPQEDAEKILQIENSLANALAYQTRFDEAEQLYEVGLEKARTGSLWVTLAEIESNLGYLSLLRGDYSRCINLFESSRGRYEQLGMSHQAAVAEQEVADIYLELNLFTEAKNIYRRTIPVFEELGMRAEQARALAYLARAEAAIGENDGIKTLLEKARELYKLEMNPIGQAIIGLIEARDRLRIEDHSSGVGLARESGAIFRESDTWSKAIEASMIEAEALSQSGDNAAAREVIIEAREQAMVRHLPQSQLQCQIALGALEFRIGEHSLAEDTFLQAIELIELIRAPLPGEEVRAGFFADKLLPYLSLAQINLGKETKASVEQAFEFVEKSRSRALMDTLTDRSPKVNGDDPAVVRLVEQRSDILRELSWLYRLPALNAPAQVSNKVDTNRKIRERELAVGELTRRIAARTTADRVFGAAEISAERMISSIGTETAIVEYFIVKDQISAFVLTDEGVRAFGEISDRSVVTTLLSRMDQLISQQKLNSSAKESENTKYIVRNLLGRLFDVLLRPLSRYYDHRNLIVVPAQELNYVPFHALFDGFEYLIESREVSYAPSAGFVFREDTETTSGVGQSILFGVTDDQAPYISEELSSLSRILSDSQTFSNSSSTVENLLRNAPNANLLHLACHGRFRADNPLFSSLELFDGSVTVREVSDLDLQNCRLAVLSACETGLNGIARGEEIFGLVRGFLSAGATNLVISLWQVDDVASTDLMIEFYRAIEQGVAPIRALAEAQRKVMKSFPHPFYWAPFYIVGPLNS